MAHRSSEDVECSEAGTVEDMKSTLEAAGDCEEDGDASLPQCKIKRNYSCPVCPYFSQNPRSFLYHSRDVHFDKIKIYECSQCLYASKHSQKLQRHVNMIHVPGKLPRGSSKRVLAKVDKSVEKAEPKKETKTKSKLVMILPKKKEEEEVMVVTEEPKTEEDEDAVIDVEMVDGELKCDLCIFTCRSTTLMQRHSRVVHHKKRFLRCKKCSYVTHVKARYTKHVKYHSMPMIKCDLCDFHTPYKWNLDRHYKNHSGSGAFECSKCNFRADIKQSLTVHEMNHHVPPVGQGAVMARRKNKVGGSDTLAFETDNIDQEELELLRLEREDTDLEPIGVKRKASPSPGQTQASSKKNARTASAKRDTSNNNNTLHRDFIHPDDIVPRYGQIYVKNLKCQFCSYKAVFNHEIWRHEKRIHGHTRVESKKKKRPPPNLIPIQNKPTPPTSPILRIPTIKPKSRLTSLTASPPEKTIVNETEFNELCKKSCLTSSLKDFVSLIGDEEGLKNIPDPQVDVDVLDDVQEEEGDAKKLQTDLLKKKNASFFDKLKEKLMTGANDDCNLVCDFCGHESKCLSESVAHQKRHAADVKIEPESPENEVFPLGAELSSTRCQHCRQRCKTSADLLNHLKACKAFGAAYDQLTRFEDEEDSEVASSMENRVFVWNEFSQDHDEEMDEDLSDSEENDELVIDTATGFGAVTSKGSDNTESGTLVTETDPGLSLTAKKVFKCPHCSFWASTASRFHVHIVGHLNKKPFECSLCAYRSNWRWDITKHIRLKSARDPSHVKAHVNMTDETGRRNYSKYNKYLTMMKVQEPRAESSGSGRRSRSSDATQGTVADKDLIQPLPAPPRLTRAPAPGPALHIPQGAPLRPPPPLKAAHQVLQRDKDSRSGQEKEVITKKTLWKCKKCHFRDSNKDNVLAHVKQHYKIKRRPLPRGPQDLEDETPASAASPEETPDPDSSGTPGTPGTKAFRCGHCAQRHCRLKHDGDVKVSAASAKQRLQSVPEMGIISCDICPFSTETEGDLTAHKLNHVDRPGSIFKCSYCPFYVPSKIAVMEHMEVHGVENAEELACLKVDSFEPNEWNEAFKKQGTSVGKEDTKRYRCRQCPYVSNSRTQFLYHKQFHRPRNAPFKCMYCSYNVTRRHLLHQHLRVHHRCKDPPRFLASASSELDTAGMQEIPLVWVEKGGGYFKMFKCRWCPHVNVRKVNIQEHEKMHQGPRDDRRLQCEDCTYMSNNAGALTSHVKVHQGLYGEVRSLYDPTRSDAVQISSLEKAPRIVEPEVVITVEGDDEVMDKELQAQPESSYHQTHLEIVEDDERNKLLSFCNKCPARFFFKKELRIHIKFHLIRLPFRCLFCSYTARQRPHLLAHYKVHSQEYQQKTAGLVDSYMVCAEYPQPKTAIIAKQCDVMEGPVWMVVFQGLSKPMGKHPCPRCPAKFFKSVALQYHLSLHGGQYQHKCKFCDYTVKTYGNLMKHQLVHENVRFGRPRPGKQGNGVLLSDPPAAQSSNGVDPQFGTLMHGSPDFIYPTYLKNGKVKVKRYKCHKCPSAFEKRDQYRIHLSLHGSKQKYSCDKCDYSVKYFANYVQHIRKHHTHDAALEARRANGDLKQHEAESSEERKPAMAFELTLVEQQTLMLQDRRGTPLDLDEKKGFWCEFCPYQSHRRDQVENHMKRHLCVSGVRAPFDCIHCDYSATQINFLKDHMKQHFQLSQRHKAEAYLKCEGLELWCVEENKEERMLVFHDRGEGYKHDDRFLPPVERQDEDWRVFVNPETGDAVEGLGEELIEMVEVKRKVKRWRGKNWICRKCPHAFGKKDQYLRHVALHGSKQQHNCDICDYSVKFYTNYVQHMRMHQKHEPDKDIVLRKNRPEMDLDELGSGVRQNDVSELSCLEETDTTETREAEPERCEVDETDPLSTP